MRCVSFCTAESYNVDNLARFLREEELEPKFYSDLVHVQKQIDERIIDVFYFPYGCVSIWGAEEEDIQKILDDVKAYQIKSLSEIISDSSNYVYGDETKIIEENDEIILENDDVLIKLSISCGLSQSVKLTGFEQSIDRTIEATKYLPKELAEKGKISLSRKKISQKLGALFAERNSINLYTDILDTPEFFWRRPRYEPYYQMAAAYMDISTRLDILNRRLAVIHELYEILSNELKHLHSSRLELVIVVLIFIEVVLAFLRDIFK
ncbi:MAG: RMD1 family protein, partial [Proteobacteria bacterium]|nr:RMD1 family protein [Pseudomonadota bacterium]